MDSNEIKFTFILHIYIFISEFENEWVWKDSANFTFSIQQIWHECGEPINSAWWLGPPLLCDKPLND